MHLRDLRIRAMDGSVIVDGVLRIESDEPAAATLPTREGRLVGVNLQHGGFGKVSFSLYGETRRAGDGFWGAAAPLMTVNLEEGVPDLQALLARAFKGGRLQAKVDQFRLASITVRYPLAGQGEWRHLYGQASALDLTLGVEEDGLRISFNGPVEPMAFNEAPLFTRARVVGDLLVPREYWRIRGLTGPMWPARNNSRVGDWTPEGAALGTAAFGGYGGLYCPGHLDWGQPANGLEPPGPFVDTRLGPHQMTLQTGGELQLLANGFAAARRYHSDGPEFVLFLGHDDWARILEAHDEAELEWRGGGAGHLDGRTGRDVYEYGPRRQPLSSLQLRARRGQEGLRVEGRGELGPLQDGDGEPLGPKLQFDVMIPRAWFLMRGLPLRQFWADWKREFPSATTW